MKVTLYMAITANGMIAKKNDDTPWSDAEFESYLSTVKKFGNVIVGNRTHPLYEESDFPAMGNPLMVVLTRNENLKEDGRVKYVNSPNKALEIVEAAGFKEALVTGGGFVNTAFIEKGLVDEIYLDIEPLVFGEGIPLFQPGDFECELELLETEKLSENTIQLHYKVKK